MNGQRRAGAKESLTVRLRQSCDLAGRFGVTTVFPKGNFPRFADHCLGRTIMMSGSPTGTPVLGENLERGAPVASRRADGIFESAGEMAGKRAANAHPN
jgi:hypothetical protein